MRFLSAFASTLIGCGLIAAGLVVFPLPIPLGLVMIIAGLAMVLAGSRTARRWFKQFRTGHPQIDRLIIAVEHHLPRLLEKPLEETDGDPTGRGEGDGDRAKDDRETR